MNRNNIIIHIVPDGDWARGGVAYSAIRLAHEQGRIGLDVFILEIDTNRRVIAPWWCINVNYIDKDENLTFFMWFIKIRSFLILNKPIIHFHGFWNLQFLPYFILAIICKINFIVSPHGSIERGALNHNFFKKYITRKIYIDRILLRSTEIWACSVKEYNSIKREFPNVMASIFPIGIDVPDLLFPNHDVIQKDQRKIILVISRFNPGKGLINLIRAWDKIRDPCWRIIIAGPDEKNYKSIILREIAELNLESFFTFPGYVDSKERDSLYRSADIFVLPSLSENFGIVVAEAMSYGVPVLTTFETPWKYVGIERGCLCVETTPLALSNGLTMLMNLDTNERNKISLASREFVKENFHWKNIVLLVKDRLQLISLIKQ
jgi:glycosyltransferase involved in cell wall biosynthesis